MTEDIQDTDTVLDPDDLELEGDHVQELAENQYVIRAASDDQNADHLVDGETAGPLAEPPANTDTNSAALADASEPHGVDITLKTDGEIAHHHATSHDVREVFVDLLTWYAGQLDDDMSPSEALRVMLAASDIEV